MRFKWAARKFVENAKSKITMMGTDENRLRHLEETAMPHRSDWCEGPETLAFRPILVSPGQMD
jgi:hypothetical protein